MSKCCKNCYHYKVCEFNLAHQGIDLTSIVLASKYDNSADNCPHFKDKSLIMELPCKVEDILFVVDYEPLEECIDKVKCQSIEIDDYGMSIYCETIEGSRDTYVPDDFGETVFFNREEAEKALEERKNE